MNLLKNNSIKSGRVRKYSASLFLILIFPLLFLFNSCIREESFDNTPEGNFEALWKIIDEQYCFFTYKQVEYGLDWDNVHQKYKKRLSSQMTSEQLFEVLGDMLSELRDGHVNLYYAGNVSRYWKWFEDYPENFNDSVQKLYLGTDYRIASGLKYKILDDNIGYIYYESFSSAIGNSNLDEVLKYMAVCDGIIIDVRNNGGGTITNASLLASRFTEEKVLTGYVTHKIGKGHDDFSKFQSIDLEPSKRIRWQKKVAVLTNRHSYSATNDFVNSMHILPLVTIIGDKTGGGSGLPMSSELPNGWSVRFSSSPHLNAQKEQIEFGIAPDIKVDMDTKDLLRNKDTIIERARAFLKE